MDPPSSTEESKGAADLRGGGLCALVGSLLALAAPATLLLLSAHGLAGLSVGSSTDLAAESLLVAVGAVLFLLAFFVYRRGFAHLKHVDRRLRIATTLCLIGSLGALVVLVAGALASGGSSGVTACLGGHPSHALSCLRSHDPTAGFLAVAGFWLVWWGAVGVALGLVLSGRHLGRSATTAGGVLYGVLVADLVIPFAGLLVRLPVTAEALAVAPVAAVAAATLVYVGARTAGGQPR